ncbi:hypothetical protein [Kyrpidia spormannii]|uniref:hypothetical protein n=1 Tax=Kyrpidia spormannii TaxID=2055160 RepID=UPI001472B6BF|nr:hypothetical protein [Kyrpidia spormannii]
MCLVGGVFPALSPDAEAGGPVEAQKPQRPLVSVIREGAVWVLQAEGRFAPVPKTEGADRAIFSPDGRFLAVHRSEGSLWLITPDGRKGWLLAKDRVSPDMAWSPTGGRLGYIRSGALWVIPCGPEGPSDWSLAAPEAERFAWSSDGNRLYVATPAWSVPAPPKPTTPSLPGSLKAHPDGPAPMRAPGTPSKNRETPREKAGMRRRQQQRMASRPLRPSARPREPQERRSGDRRFASWK